MFATQEPPRTAYELNWSFLGIRFRVLPSFFFVTALLIGLIAYLRGVTDPVVLAFVVAINVGCLFIAMLFVSFVQGLVYRSYGLRSTVIVRELMGGINPDAEPPTALQRIVVALANPAASFLLLAVVFYSDEMYGWGSTNQITRLTFFILTAIGWFWGVIGLLPIFPYSGGRVMLEVLQLISRRNGLAITLVISILVGVSYIAYTVLVYFRHLEEIPLVKGEVLPANPILSVFFALSVMQNYQLLQLVRASRPRLAQHDDYDDDRAPWQR